jgi:hypothetical protein
MRRVTHALVFCTTVTMLGCAKTEKPPAEPAAEAPMAAPAPAALSAADVAGTWNMRVTLAGSDSTILTFVLNATGDPSTWSFNFPGRPPVPTSVTFDGDSMITSAGPYESALRKGVKVSTTGVMRLQGGKLVGATTAHYATTRADSVLQLGSEGTRAQ